MGNVLELQDLVVGYRRGFRLGPLNEVTTSGITCLLGTNGAGKSTLLRTMAGLQESLGGHAWRSASSVGYLPQDFVPPGRATCTQFLHYVAWLYDVDRHARVDVVTRALQRVDLAERAHTSIDELSGGMQRRLGIAHTLVTEAELVLLDEPTVGLDPLQVSDLLPTLRDISKEVTIWVSTHQLDVARVLADRLLVLGELEVSFQGSMEEIPAGARDSTEGFGTWVRSLMEGGGS